MTAEIAILNKGAVALAADSAVTISGSGPLKIYNTVNKIFELHRGAPVGVMIYGNLEYMEIPFETIIKMYRRDRGFEHKKAFIKDYADDFINYLESEVKMSEDHQIRNVVTIFRDHFSILKNNIRERSINIILQHGAPKVREINKAVADEIDKFIDETNTYKDAKCFSSINERDLFNKYKDEHEKVVNRTFSGLKLTISKKRKLNQLGAMLLHKEFLSDSRAGIIVAGFGEKEICPSLKSIEIDGVIDGKLKCVDGEFIDIGRDTVGADIQAFAQREMVDRFLKG